MLLGRAIRSRDENRQVGWKRVDLRRNGYGWKDERGGGWRDGALEGVRVLAIVLHRFTPVRDGRTGNEVWDLGAAAWFFLRCCGLMYHMMKLEI